jgi:hypothetical protein
MPTKKQLHFVWASQFKLFGGAGQPKQHYESAMDNHGLATQMNVDVPMVKKSCYRKSKGKKIGEVVFENGDLHLVPIKK